MQILAAIMVTTLDAAPAPLFFDFSRPNWYIGLGSGGPFLGIGFGQQPFLG